MTVRGHQTRERFVHQLLAIALVLCCSWGSPATAGTPPCPTPPGSVAALFQTTGAPVHAYVTTDSIHHTIPGERGTVRAVGLDTLEFRSRLHAQIRSGVTAFRPDTLWLLPRSRVALLFEGWESRATSPRKMGSGERVCGYLTADARYHPTVGARVWRVEPGGFEFMWSGGGQSGADATSRIMVSRDSVAALYSPEGKSSLRTHILAAAVAVALIVAYVDFTKDPPEDRVNWLPRDPGR